MTSLKWFTLSAFALALAACSSNNEDESLAADVGDASDTEVEDDTAPAARCGDGEINLASEACDGDDFGGATCGSMGFEAGELSCTAVCAIDTSSCGAATRCGDGVREGDEACDGDDFGEQSCSDYGLSSGSLRCDEDCAIDASACSDLARCGDGEVQPPEECDDGNNDDDDGCAYDCVAEVCGDGILHTGEECERVSLAECPNGQMGLQACEDCELGSLDCGDDAVCGNGILEVGEACDDGDRIDDNDCNNDCEPLTCGNGVLDDIETCDGDLFADISCADLGFTLGELTCDDCALNISDCHFARCGDGRLEGDEACDDGNRDNGDGCSRRCELEACEGGPAYLVWPDGDDDTYGDAAATPEIVCELVDGFVERGGDCDDTNASAYPGAEEVCDGADNSCDGGVDVGAVDAQTYYIDGDGDGIGAGEALTACDVPDDGVASNGDCDDTEPTVWTGADEVCDGLDNNCDGVVDGPEPLDPSVTRYVDADGDGFGTEETRAFCAGADTTGFAEETGDCDDANDSIYPGAVERCDAGDVDEDCDGFIDDDDASVDLTTFSTFYEDADDDGYGNAAVTLDRCDPTTGWVANDLDCDDMNGAVNPEGVEICHDGLDNDCDGSPGDCALPSDISADALTDRLFGAAIGDRFGSSVALLDFNGDGVGDIAVAAEGVGDNEGAAYVFFGPFSGERSAADADVTISPLYPPSGTTVEVTVASAGHFTQLGRDDLWIGLPTNDKAILVPGRDAGGVLDLTDPSLRIASGDAGSAFGSTFAHVDLDADGYDDAIIGAPVGNYVASYLGQPVDTLLTADHVEWASLDQEGSYGGSLAVGVAGGVSYLAVGMVAAGLSAEGGVAIYRLSDWAPQGMLWGIASDDQAGYHVTAAPDFDSDGIPNWLFSATRSDDGTGLAAGRVYYGEHDPVADVLLSDLASVTTDGDGAFFGACTALLDASDDGTLDLLATAPLDNRTTGSGTGIFYVLEADAPGSWPADTAAPLARVEAGRSLLLGMACDSGYDITGDGLPDIAMGAPITAIDLTSQGVVYYFGFGGL